MNTGIDYSQIAFVAASIGLGFFISSQGPYRILPNASQKRRQRLRSSHRSSKPLSIVVIGAGLIGPRHAAHVDSNPNTGLFGIVDLNPKTSEVAESLDTRYFSSVETMIEYCDNNSIKYPDGAIVCTPNHTHVEVSAKLASHGINLLVEKPVSPSPEEAKALKIFTNTKNVKVLVGHHRRFNPFIVAAKRHLSKVGKVVAIQGNWTLKKDDEYFKTSPWRTHTETGGGAILINLVHDLDLLQYLFGPIVQVYAELLPKQREYTNVDEGAALTIRFSNGACGAFICSDNVVSPFNFESCTGENPLIPYHEGIQGLYRVFGSEGTLSIPDFKLYQNKKGQESTWLNYIKSITLENKSKLRAQKPFDSQLDHFVDVIKGHTVPGCSIEDGISAALVIKAVQKSIQTGLPQPVLEITDIRPDFTALKVKLDFEDEKSQGVLS